MQVESVEKTRAHRDRRLQAAAFLPVCTSHRLPPHTKRREARIGCKKRLSSRSIGTRRQYYQIFPPLTWSPGRNLEVLSKAINAWFPIRILRSYNLELSDFKDVIPYLPCFFNKLHVQRSPLLPVWRWTAPCIFCLRPSPPINMIQFFEPTYTTI